MHFILWVLFTTISVVIGVFAAFIIFPFYRTGSSAQTRWERVQHECGAVVVFVFLLIGLFSPYYFEFPKWPHHEVVTVDKEGNTEVHSFGLFTLPWKPIGIVNVPQLKISASISRVPARNVKEELGLVGYSISGLVENKELFCKTVLENEDLQSLDRILEYALFQFHIEQGNNVLIKYDLEKEKDRNKFGNEVEVWANQILAKAGVKAEFKSVWFSSIKNIDQPPIR